MQLRLTVRRSARKAAQVLAPSESVRRDIVETYGISPERVTVIPLAAQARICGDEPGQVLPRLNRTDRKNVTTHYSVSVSDSFQFFFIYHRTKVRRCCEWNRVHALGRNLISLDDVAARAFGRN